MFLSSVHLYFMLPSKPEGGLAMYRSALVQNRHLAQLAKVNHRHVMACKGEESDRDLDQSIRLVWRVFMH